jgi:hypothetical protein
MINCHPKNDQLSSAKPGFHGSILQNDNYLPEPRTSELWNCSAQLNFSSIASAE